MTIKPLQALTFFLLLLMLSLSSCFRLPGRSIIRRAFSDEKMFRDLKKHLAAHTTTNAVKSEATLTNKTNNAKSIEASFGSMGLKETIVEGLAAQGIHVFECNL